jgi:hypothetical protein
MGRRKVKRETCSVDFLRQHYLQQDSHAVVSIADYAISLRGSELVTLRWRHAGLSHKGRLRPSLFHSFEKWLCLWNKWSQKFASISSSFDNFNTSSVVSSVRSLSYKKKEG